MWRRWTVCQRLTLTGRMLSPVYSDTTRRRVYVDTFTARQLSPISSERRIPVESVCTPCIWRFECVLLVILAEDLLLNISIKMAFAGTEELEDRLIELWQRNACLYHMWCYMVTDGVKKRTMVESVRYFDVSIHSILPYDYPTPSSPEAETGVINYFFKFIHQMTPPSIPAVVINLFSFAYILSSADVQLIAVTHIGSYELYSNCSFSELISYFITKN